MNAGKYVFAQLVDFLPQRVFDTIVSQYVGNKYVRHFSCWNQMLCMLFGQLTHRESLRDLIVVLDAHGRKSYHLGLGKSVTRSNLSKANERRSYKIFEAYSRKNDKTTGVLCDQIGKLSGYQSQKQYPEKIRRIKYYDAETKKIFVFLTNNMELTALQIALLYKNRWQVELFFKWIKQHLKIKSFWGTTENAVRIQIYSAIIAYCLVSIVAAELKIERSTYEILQIIGISLLDKTTVNELLTDTNYKNDNTTPSNQLTIKWI